MVLQEIWHFSVGSWEPSAEPELTGGTIGNRIASEEWGHRWGCLGLHSGQEEGLPDTKSQTFQNMICDSLPYISIPTSANNVHKGLINTHTGKWWNIDNYCNMVGSITNWQACPRYHLPFWRHAFGCWPELWDWRWRFCLRCFSSCRRWLSSWDLRTFPE